MGGQRRFTRSSKLQRHCGNINVRDDIPVVMSVDTFVGPIVVGPVTTVGPVKGLVVVIQLGRYHIDSV